MRELYLFILFIWIAYFVNCQINFSCSSSYCKQSKCPPLDCEGGRIIKNASKCGCCHICIKPLKEGAPCDTKLYASIPRVECGPGLTCDGVTSRCVPMKTRCVQSQQKYDKKYDNMELTIGPPRPECDNFGDFAPVQCKQGRICYCVDKDGKRIFGTAPYWQRDQMHCNCSRQYEKFKNRLTDITHFLRCTANGNYDSFQCADNLCYCIDKYGQLEGRYVAKNHSNTGLKCYKSQEYDEYLNAPCFKKLMEVRRYVKQYITDFNNAIGIDFPRCDIDGTYAPFQCEGDRCYCVQKDGTKIRETGVNRYLIKDSMCHCVREKEMLEERKDQDKINNYFSKYKCNNETGNYESKQCVESQCYCVDESGFQSEIGQIVNIIDSHVLNCKLAPLMKT